MFESLVSTLFKQRSLFFFNFSFSLFLSPVFKSLISHENWGLFRKLEERRGGEDDSNSSTIYIHSNLHKHFRHDSLARTLREFIPFPTFHCPLSLSPSLSLSCLTTRVFRIFGRETIAHFHPRPRVFNLMATQSIEASSHRR